MILRLPKAGSDDLNLQGGEFEPRDVLDWGSYAAALLACAAGKTGLSIDEHGYRLTSNFGHVSLQTSGTGGSPKIVFRELSLGQYLTRTRRNWVWFHAFAPNRWAAITTLLHATVTGGSISTPTGKGFGQVAETISVDRPDALVITPTMLRFLARHHYMELKKCDPKLISLGGEAASRSDLDCAREIWPFAQVSHTYASTEFGDIFRANDGQSGFPLSVLDREGFQLDGDGQLWIRGKATGDFWDISEERVHFRSRESSSTLINGNLVDVHEVRKAALSLDTVEMAKVVISPSSLLGNFLTLTYVGSADEGRVRRELLGLLPRESIPTVISRLDVSDAEETWKSS